MSKSKNALQKAIEAANQAVLKDQAGDARAALAQYDDALGQMRRLLAGPRAPRARWSALHALTIALRLVAAPPKSAKVRAVLEAKLREYGARADALRAAQPPPASDTVSATAGNVKKAKQTDGGSKPVRRMSSKSRRALEARIEQEYDAGGTFYIVLAGATLDGHDDPLDALPALRVLSQRAAELDTTKDRYV